MSAGMDVANRYAAPVPVNAGLMLLTVGFIALIAVAVDLLCAGLARAPLAGLALLALYSVPVASIPDGVPALGFIPGAAAFMSLLMVSERERLAHWGRHVARSPVRDQSDVVDTSSLVSTGRRISVFAIAAAVVLPVLVPTFTTSLFSGSDGLGDGNGSLSFSDPMVSLASALHRKDPVDLIRVTSDQTPSYLRLAVLDQPGPDAWRNSGVDLAATVPADGALPPPAGLVTNVREDGGSMNIQLLPDFPGSDTVWLPVPYHLTTLSMFGFPGEFAFVPRDETVTSRTAGSVGHVTSYLVNYATTLPTSQQLRSSTPAPADIEAEFGGVPAGVPAVVGQYAQQITAGLTNDYDRALALQSFFRDRNNFRYDLNAGYGDGYHAMALFLQKRRGYCQHFAATMAMMAREIGIPARVVVGFLAPSTVQSGNEYVFSSGDAHAWPELYFGGIGWVRFEPTPGNGAIPPPYTSTVAVPPITAPKNQPTTAPAPTGGGKTAGEVPATPTPSGANAQASGGGGDGGVPPIPWLVAILVLLLVLTPGTIRWGIRRSRLARAVDGGASSEYAWLELRDRILDLRLPWTGSLTPRARSRFVEPLLGGDPDGVAALDRLSLTVERARYASSPLLGAQPAEDARQIMTAIGQHVDRRHRVQAFLWPSSLMPELRGIWAGLRARLSSRPRVAQP
jgi:transglutaminase-like putative cysteine protease